MTRALSHNLFTFYSRQAPRERSIAYSPPRPVTIEPKISPSMGTSITILGNRFGTFDTSPQARLAGTACKRTVWQSDSSVVCLAARGLQPPPCSGVLGASSSDQCLAAICKTCKDGFSSTKCDAQYDTVNGLVGQGFCQSVVVRIFYF